MTGTNKTPRQKVSKMLTLCFIILLIVNYLSPKNPELCKPNVNPHVNPFRPPPPLLAGVCTSWLLMP